MEFFRGARAISEKTKVGFVPAMVELTHRNTRRYGGYLVHMGIVLMFIGFTGHAFNQSEVKEMSNRDTMRIGTYNLKVLKLEQGENENYQWHRASIEVTKNGSYLTTLEPEKRFYLASREGISEVGLRQRPNEDLYLNFAGMSDDNQRAVIQAYVFPLVSWIWIGGLVLIGGTLICLVPSKVKRQYARTEVVGYAKRHETVKK
jgi:cytochrome c-type biogenesis protein CcmF